jgi:hypothetical protein
VPWSAPIRLAERLGKYRDREAFPAFAVLAAAVLAAIGFWAKPGYIEFSIPVAKHLGGGAFWCERQ